MRQIKINSTIGTEIISLADVKNYVRIDTSADDDLIADMIIQARIFCENYISRDIVSKNRTYYLPKSSGLFDLPFAPVTSVSSVTAEGVEVTFRELGLDDLSIQLNGGPALEVKATYVTTGINDGLIKQALLQLVSTLYDNRADYVTGTIVSGVKTDVKSLLTSYKMMFI
jgi:hypothetical protein